MFFGFIWSVVVANGVLLIKNTDNYNMRREDKRSKLGFQIFPCYDGSLDFLALVRTLSSFHPPVTSVL